MATNINNKLVCNEPHANLDSYYGPYNSVHEAFVALADATVNGVNYTKKYIGLTVGVWNSAHNEVIEYWFKGGLNESNLVLKTSDSGGLPDGVKVVTFDKNGGSGVQNSLLTDTSGQLRLPECTLTKSGDTFKKWSYNGSEKSEGDIITVTTSTAVKAVWQSTPTQYYTVSWTNSDNVTIKGRADRPISSGDSLPKGTIVTLTATPTSGYTLIDWTHKPTGATKDGNNLTFILNSNTLNITAVVEAETQYYTVSWTAGVHISSISGKYNGNTPITSGSTQIPAGSTVTLTANAESGCQFTQWSNLPSGVSTSSNPVTFTLNGSVSGITAVGEVVTQEFILNFNPEGDAIEKIEGWVNGEEVNSGDSHAEGDARLTVTIKDGYDNVKIEWAGAPQYAETEDDGKTLVFSLKEDTDIIAIAKEETQNYFVSWEPTPTGLNIEGYLNGVDKIEPEVSLPQGSEIKLVATPDDGYIFKKWEHTPEDAQEDGNILMFILNNDVREVSAVAEVVTQYYTVSWTNKQNVTITGKYNESTPITSGSTQIPGGSRVVLTATPASGYIFNGWVNVPGGAVTSNNVITIASLNNNVSGVSANVKAESQEFILNFNPEGDAIEKIEGWVNGEEVNSGDSHAEGDARLTVTIKDGYDNVKIEWAGAPQYAETEDDGKTLVFSLKEDTDIIAIAKEETQNYSVSWESAPTGLKIEGYVNDDVKIEPEVLLPQGSEIKLVATPDDGYIFKKWENTPEDAQENDNILIFILNNDVREISAVAESTVQYYTVSWTNGNNISISGKYNGNTPITSGSTQIPAGSTVVLTATPDEGYKFSAWSAYPSGATTSGNTLTIQQLSSNVSGVTAVASINNDVYIYGSETKEYFTAVEELTLQEYTTVMFEPYNFKSYYAVVQTNVAPKYRDYVKQNGSIVDNSDFKDMLALNDCGQPSIIQHFEGNGWVESGSNKTKGGLKSLGNYIFILKDDTLINKNVEIKFR